MEQEVEEIDVDATTNNFDDLTAASIPPLGRAMDEAVAALVARPTLASDSPILTGTCTEQVVAPSAVRQKLSNPSLIPLNTSAFQPSAIPVRGDLTAALTKRAEQRAVLPLLEVILRLSLTAELQVWALVRDASTHPKLQLNFRIAGLLVDNGLLYYVVKNIKIVLDVATTMKGT